MRDVPVQAANQFGVATVTQALAAGWTSHALRHAADAGDIERLRLGVYAFAPAEDASGRLRQAATAYSLVNPGVPVSHASAGAVLDLHLLDVPDRVCATYPRGQRGPAAGVHRHRGRYGRADLGRAGPVLLTQPARTVLDIGHEHGADAAVVAADCALRQRWTTPSRLASVADGAAGWPGIAPVREALLLADGAAESPLESISRLRLHTSGLPAPRLQVPMFGLRGEFLGRPDFCWDEVGVVGEADGLVKYDGKPLSLIEEKRRQGRLEDAGLIVVRWGWTDLRDFHRVTTELLAAFGRALRPDRAPRLWRTGPWPHTGAAS